ncbi:lipopolysaccharide biosynthesis protein [Cellulomonas sp. McL0617]|uniref:lipopolysaccharide biosynthesis protein n=1 Tax=Cellulomonas sp. McL0617 TaxID=3415675 RepID=UPI003CF83CCC
MTDAVDELAPAVAADRGRGGFIPVALGLGVFGLTTYGFLGRAGQALGPELFAPLSVLWTIVNAVGIGLFLPFEQELGRTTAARRAQRQGNGPVVAIVLRVAALVAAAVVVLALLGAQVLASDLLGHRGNLVLLLVLALLGMGLSYIVRGLLSGNGHFGRYGAQLAVDGLLRFGTAAVLAAVGVRDPAAYGVVLVVAPVLAVVLTTPRRRGALVAPGPTVARADVVRAMTVLLVASVSSQLLANAGPLIVQVLARPSEQALAGKFLAALVIARVPLFLFAAVQAVLLPGLAALVAAGAVRAFVRRLGLVTGVTAVIAAFGVLVMWLWGNDLVGLLFGSDFGVGQDTILLIAVSGALFMLAQLAAQALLALGAEAWVVVGWCAGLAALVGACFAGGPVVHVAAVALVVGSGVALLVLGVAAVVRGARWRARVRHG